MTVLLPILVCVIGALAYALSSNGKVAEMGRLAFVSGLFIAVWQYGPKVVELLER